MKLIVGLGNPGRKYKKTRHNIGFRVLDELASDLKFVETRQCLVSTAKLNKTILAKPQTFMNNSGEAVLAIQKYYKIKTADIIVVHDELDLDFGKIRKSTGSRAAGHKGVQSIIDLLDTKDFTRVRVGIGPKPDKIPSEKFVLQKFSRKEEKELGEIIEKAIDIIKTVVP